MDRRGFLKGLTTAAAATTVPFKVLPVIVPKVVTTTYRNVIIRTRLPSAQWRKLYQGKPYIWTK